MFESVTCYRPPRNPERTMDPVEQGSLSGSRMAAKVCADGLEKCEDTACQSKRRMYLHGSHSPTLPRNRTFPYTECRYEYANECSADEHDTSEIQSSVNLNADINF